MIRQQFERTVIEQLEFCLEEVRDIRTLLREVKEQMSSNSDYLAAAVGSIYQD
jgi:hypothetical protein